MNISKGWGLQPFVAAMISETFATRLFATKVEHNHFLTRKIKKLKVLKRPNIGLVSGLHLTPTFKKHLMNIFLLLFSTPAP